ncbi:MAG TPA: hypothetical protein VHN74_19435 [Candidatus Angelobacter sp.]|nr:hypothetical protein [Candidatus Angelobacter sp.]
MRRKWYFIAPAAIAGMILFAFLGGELVRLLWNWLAPSLFGWRQITFWQALGLLAICRILFGGFGCHRGHGWRGRHRMAERWESMTPEERERWRQNWRSGRCGPFEPPAPTTSA